MPSILIQIERVLIPDLRLEFEANRKDWPAVPVHRLSAFRERARTRKVSGSCQGSDTFSLFSARGCARVREACELIDHFEQIAKKTGYDRHWKPVYVQSRLVHPPNEEDRNMKIDRILALCCLAILALAFAFPARADESNR
jgi:hypothetical protein